MNDLTKESKEKLPTWVWKEIQLSTGTLRLTRETQKLSTENREALFDVLNQFRESEEPQRDEKLLDEGGEARIYDISEGIPAVIKVVTNPQVGSDLSSINRHYQLMGIIESDGQKPSSLQFPAYYAHLHVKGMNVSHKGYFVMEKITDSINYWDARFDSDKLKAYLQKMGLENIVKEEDFLEIANQVFLEADDYLKNLPYSGLIDYYNILPDAGSSNFMIKTVKKEDGTVEVQGWIIDP